MNPALFCDLLFAGPGEEFFEKTELLELLNITPTESEAWDIVQMEEIERELLDGDDMEFDKNA
jgi:hypothetical protein